MRTIRKNKENKKKHVSNFSTLSIDDMKTKTKTQICFVGKKIKYSAIAKTQQHLHNRPKTVQLYYKKTPPQDFFERFPRIHCLMEHLQLLLLKYDKSFLVKKLSQKI